MNIHHNLDGSITVTDSLYELEWQIVHEPSGWWIRFSSGRAPAGPYTTSDAAIAALKAGDR